MSTYYHATTIECLGLFGESEMSVKDLAAKHSVTRAVARNRIDNLHSHRLIESRREGCELIYSITRKGEYLLRRFRPKEDGPLPEPRQPIMVGNYDGADLKPYEGRVGAMTAYTLPSLQGGREVPRKAPISMGCA